MIALAATTLALPRGLPRLTRLENALANVEGSLDISLEMQSRPSEARKATAWASDLLDMEKYESEEDAWKGLFAEQTAPDYDWLHAKFKGVVFHKQHGMPEVHAALADLEANKALPAEMRDAKRVQKILLGEMSRFFHNNEAALEDAHKHKHKLRQRLTDAVANGISEKRKTSRALERKATGKHAMARALSRKSHADGALLDMERERIFGWIVDLVEWVVVKVVEIVEACATAIYNAAKWVVDNFACILCNLGCLIVTVCVKAAVYGTGVGFAIDVAIKAVLQGFKKLIKDFIKSTGIEAFFQAKCIGFSYVGDWVSGPGSKTECPKDSKGDYIQRDCQWGAHEDDYEWLGRVSNSIAGLFGFTLPSMMTCVRSICVAVFQTILDVLTDGPLDAFLGFVTGQVQSFICPDCTTLSNDCYDNLKDQIGNLKGLDFKGDSITPEQIQAKVEANKKADTFVPISRDVIHPCDAAEAFSRVTGPYKQCYVDEFAEHHDKEDPDANCVVRTECKQLEAAPSDVDGPTVGATVNGKTVEKTYDWSEKHFKDYNGNTIHPTVDPLNPGSLPDYCHDPNTRRTGKGCPHQCKADADCQGDRTCDKSAAVNGVGWCKGESNCCGDAANNVANKPTPSEWGQGREGSAAGLTTKKTVSGGSVCRLKSVGKTPQEMKQFVNREDPDASTPEAYAKFFCISCPIDECNDNNKVPYGEQWCPEGEDQEGVYDRIYKAFNGGFKYGTHPWSIVCPNEAVYDREGHTDEQNQASNEQDRRMDMLFRRRGSGGLR